jgi:hypothetical protein
MDSLHQEFADIEGRWQQTSREFGCHFSFVIKISSLGSLSAIA